MKMSNFSFSCFVNVSSSSLSDYGWILEHPGDPDFNNTGNGYAISTIVIIFFLLGVPWNLLVIGAIIKKKLYTQPIIMLMLNLALTNLLVALVVMPFNIVTGIKGEYIFGETDLIRCRVCQTGIMVILLPWVSIHTLSLMAVDRFIYLKQPLKYTTIITPVRTCIALVAVWVLCLVLSLPPLFGFGEIRFSYTVANCVPIFGGSTHIALNYYYIVPMTVEAFFAVLIVFITYVWVVCIVRRSLIMKLRRSVSILSKEGVKVKSASKEYSKSQLHLMWLFGAIFTANIITWAPLMGLGILTATVDRQQIPTVLYTFPYLTFLFETVIHPMLEVCLIQDIREGISDFFTMFKGKLRAFFRFKT